MGIRKYKPTTPGRRGASVSDFVELTRSTPGKSLLIPKPKTGSRNNSGHIATRHIDGGHKQAYRIVGFKRYDKDGVPAKAAHIGCDPNHTTRIALLHYRDGEKRYIITPNGLTQDTVVVSDPDSDIEPGNNLELRQIPIGTTVHAVKLHPGGGARLDRSADAAIQLVVHEGKYAILRIPSGEMRVVDVHCRVAIGTVGNAEQSNINWGETGHNRWKGTRPTVRGVVMNPVDHPHDGGGDHTLGGRHPMSPWGKPGGHIHDKNKTNSRLIVRRRKTSRKR